MARLNPQIRAWRRIASSDPCPFCYQLTLTLHPPGSAKFPAHDSCSCTAEPVYEDEPEVAADAATPRPLLNTAIDLDLARYLALLIRIEPPSPAMRARIIVALRTASTADDLPADVAAWAAGVESRHPSEAIEAAAAAAVRTV